MSNEFKIFKKLKCVQDSVVQVTALLLCLKKTTLKKIMSWSWDPTLAANQGTLTATCPLSMTATASTRIKRDLLSILTEPYPGLHVVGDESNLKIVHALILGVKDTPYEGGFFYFVLNCPDDYPIHPPKVKLMTTDAGRVRFNPNLYQSGKVCLSLLGTWGASTWSPAQQLSSLLLSIQSIMNEKPYFNEPGYEKEREPGDSKRYNEYIQYETLRVSVCGMLENKCHLAIPEQLKDIMEKTFLQSYDQYTEIAKNNMHMDGSDMIEPFTKVKHRCRYKALMKRLENIHKRLLAKNVPVLLNAPPTEGPAEIKSEETVTL